MDLPEYKMEDFMLNDSFVRYCLQTDAADVAFWEDFAHRHPDQQANIEAAREWVLRLGSRLTTEEKQTAFEQLKARIETPAANVIPARRNYKWFAAAAIATLAIVTFVWSWQLKDNQRNSTATPVAYTTYKADSLHRREVLLSDGSRIWLNNNSSLQVPADYGTNSRRVLLTGEALCEVAPGAAQPFIVATGQVQVLVLGTAFRIRAYNFDSSVTVALLSGKVKVAAGKAARRELQPGEAVRIHENNIIPAPMDIDREQNWQQGRLLFRDAAIPDIAAALQDWYGVKVNVTPGNYKPVHFNGEFINKSMQDVTTAITYITGIKIDQKKGQLFISQ